MSLVAYQAVWEHTKTKGVARLLMLALADHHHPQREICWPGKARLAEFMGCHVESVDAAIRKCEELGELEVIRGGGRHRTNEYRILLPMEEKPVGAAGKSRKPNAYNGEESSPSYLANNRGNSLEHTGGYSTETGGFDPAYGGTDSPTNRLNREEETVYENRDAHECAEEFDSFHPGCTEEEIEEYLRVKEMEAMRDEEVMAELEREAEMEAFMEEAYWAQLGESHCASCGSCPCVSAQTEALL